MTETYHGFIDTAHDALLMFEACNAGMLPRVQRRFSDRERQTIRSGAVYVWDEEETGMRRWTDGRTWSPSRVHGCFLIYYELEGRRHQFVTKQGASTVYSNRSSRNSPRNGQKESSPASLEPCPPNIMQKEQGLIKKALSLNTSDNRKVHLVCYYSREDVERGSLLSPSNDPGFANIKIVEERYPELGSGVGRFDRYGGGRARSSGSNNASRQGSSTSISEPSPSSSQRDGPPAYMRSALSLEKRTRSYRSEAYRYPSYGPYAGPIRHVNVVPAGVAQQHQQHYNARQRPSSSIPIPSSATLSHEHHALHPSGGPLPPYSPAAGAGAGAPVAFVPPHQNLAKTMPYHHQPVWQQQQQQQSIDPSRNYMEVPGVNNRFPVGSAAWKEYPCKEGATPLPPSFSSQQQQQQQQQHFPYSVSSAIPHSSEAVRLPAINPIENGGASQSMSAMQRTPPAMVDMPSPSRMNSEDMRQLASLRISL